MIVPTDSGSEPGAQATKSGRDVIPGGVGAKAEDTALGRDDRGDRGSEDHRREQSAGLHPRILYQRV